MQSLIEYLMYEREGWKKKLGHLATQINQKEGIKIFKEKAAEQY
jgi:hypothetical protein